MSLDSMGERARPNDVEGRSGSALVLVVDDYEPSRFLRSRLLRDAGFRVVEAGTLKEAVEAVERESPAVAVLDVNLPDGDGVSLCEQWHDARAHFPVILISAVSLTAENRRRGIAAGARAYLLDPIPAEILVKTVRRVLQDPAEQSNDSVVVTEISGAIIAANQTAERFLNTTQKGLLGRNLLIFFDGDRDVWRQEMSRSASGSFIRRPGTIRPKERRPVNMQVQIQPDDDWGRTAVRWIFSQD